MNYKWYQFDPDKNFLELSIVRLMVILLVTLSIAISIAIIVNEDLYFSFDSAGFNNLITLFRFPLGMLALLIPILALFAANHRSVQTKAQTRASNDQNKFTNYYKHREEFLKYISDIIAETTQIDDQQILHRKLFGELNDFNYHITNDSIKKFIQDIDELLEKIYPLKEKALDKPFFIEVYDIEERFKELCSLFNIIALRIFSKRKDLEYGGRTTRYSAYPLTTFIHYISSSIKLINKILEFDSSYKTSESTLKLITMHTSDNTNTSQERRTGPIDIVMEGD